MSLQRSNHSPFFRLTIIVPLSLLSLSPCHPVTGSADPPVTFQVQTAAGGAASGPLLELGAAWRVRLGGPQPRRTEADDLLELRQVGRPLPRMPEGEQLVFVNGDRLPGAVVKLVGERLHFRPRLATKAPDERELTPPLSALALIWLADLDTAPHADRLRRELLAGKRTRDVVHLRNGDVVEGILTGLDDKSVQVEVERKPLDIKRERIAVIALNTELAVPLRPKGAYGRAVLAGGARLALATAACADGKTLTGTTFFQAPVRVPLEEVVALYVHQGKAVYLSDVKPKQYQYTPFLPGKLNRPYVADGGADGRDLRLADSTFDKGLGMPGGSRITFDLAGGYRRFEALVGLAADPDGPGGSVRLRVLVDDKLHDLTPDRDLTARDGPLPVRIDVTGAKALTLAVDFGRGGPVQDRVNWADARLIR
jgi:hypothetical protein